MSGEHYNCELGLNTLREEIKKLEETQKLHDQCVSRLVKGMMKAIEMMKEGDFYDLSLRVNVTHVLKSCMPYDPLLDNPKLDDGDTL